jgi:predicted neuraminidase
MRALLFASIVCCAFAGELHIERVFGPEVQTGRYKHPTSIAALANGDLYLVYYGGAGEYAVNTGVFGARLAKGAAKWTDPKLIAADPFRSVGNGVIWQAPDGTVWLFYVVRYGATWSTSRIQGKVSRDNGETWSDSFVVSDHEGMMVRNRPIVLDTGEYLLPVYHETGHNTEIVGPDSTSRFLRFDPSGKSREWAESGVIRSKKGNIQPGVVQLSKDYLIAYCRRGGGYGPVPDGYAIRSESHDGGRTWAEGTNSPFRNPNSAVEFMKLHSGNLLMVFNDSMHQRTPLVAALSTDGDKTWPHRRTVGDQPKQSYAYPYATQAADGRIHLVYTSDNRTTIYHAVFDEEWVKGNGR